jgi:hypothetical protein
MIERFKAGDIVERIGTTFFPVIRGERYTVEAHDADILRLVGLVGAYLPGAFEKVGSTSTPLMVLTADATERKGIPITTGVLDYFPLAVAEVAKVSKAGNDQHNPGQPLHWARGKSIDHHDCIARHLIDRGTIDTDGQRHSAKLAWRALAALQVELEQERGLFLDAK